MPDDARHVDQPWSPDVTNDRSDASEDPVPLTDGDILEDHAPVDGPVDAQDGRDASSRCEETPSELLEATTYSTTYARTTGGCVWRWDAVENMPPSRTVTPPVLVQELRDVRSLSRRVRFFVVTGTVARHVSLSSVSDPQLPDIPDAVEVADALGGVCAILSNRTVRCLGTFARGTTATYDRPTPVAGVADALRIGGYQEGLLASLADGRTVTWGADLRAREVPALAGAVAFDAGDDYLCALLRNGTVKCAGSNEHRVCAPTTRASYALDEAVAIDGLSDVRQIAVANWGAAYALRGDGRLLRWGRVRMDYTFRPLPSPPTPELVPELTDVVRITGGRVDLLAVRRDGSVWSLHTPSVDGVPRLERVAGFGPP